MPRKDLKHTKVRTVTLVSAFKSDFRNLSFLSDPAVNNLQQRHIRQMILAICIHSIFLLLLYSSMCHFDGQRWSLLWPNTIISTDLNTVGVLPCTSRTLKSINSLILSLIIQFIPTCMQYIKPQICSLLY